MDSNFYKPGPIAKIRGLFIVAGIACFIMLFLGAFRLHAQDLTDDGKIHKLVTPPHDLARDGSVLDYTIPPNTPYSAISFELRGGDGGKATTKSSCAAWGGDGALVNFSVSIGDGAHEVPAGSSIRFIIGKAGDSPDKGSGTHAMGGGGGGTAVLARFPGKTGDTDWIILGAAGGGSGAEAKHNFFKGCMREQAGQGGRSFNWSRDKEGDGGNAGGKNGEAGGGGGGAYHDGGGGDDNEGKAGYPNGGKGGSGITKLGGWGFGGGGGGGIEGNTFHGGGGGGYTGGNATQGGGSWVNATYSQSTIKIPGGASDPTENGYTSYLFISVCSINSVTTTPATCGASGSATINAATTCSGDFKYAVRLSGSSGTPTGSASNTFSGLVAGNYVAYIWRGEFSDGITDQYEFTIEQGTCDAIAPVITLNGDNPIYIGPGATYSEPGATATDDTDGDITNNIVIGGDNVNTNIEGEYEITYDVKDKTGNAATQVTRTVIVDFTAPVITLQGDNPMYLGPGGAYSDPGATAGDNIDGDITNNIVVGGDVVDVSTEGTYVVIYTVQDQVGNAAREERTVIVDFTAPVIALNGNNPIHLEPGDTYSEPGARATDDIDGDITNNIVVGGDVVDVNTEGTYIVTYTVQDRAGNAAQKERTVIVGLDNGPVITLNGDNPMYIGPGGTYTEPGATATDDIDGNITDKIVIGGDVVDVSTEGIYIVTYTAQDQAGNVTQVERKVIVDLTAPVIILSGDNPLYIGPGGAYSEPGVTATDNIDGTITDKVEYGGDLVDSSIEGEYNITYDVKDRAGNAAIRKTRTAIVDLTGPEITLNGDNPMYIGQGDTYSEPGATAIDAIDGVLTDDIVIGGDIVDVTTAGTYIVTYNVQDQVGNAAIEVTRTVIVDLTAPVITLNGDNPMYIGQGGTYSDPGARAGDNIDGDITGNIVVGGDAVNTNIEGTYKVTYTVQDQAGNTAREERTVIVDLTAPEISLNGDNPMYMGPGDAYSEPGATAGDNTDGDITNNIVIGGDVVDVSTEGTYMVIYEVQDQAGNTAREERTVIVDLTAPEISLNGDNPMYIGPGDAYSEPGATATDNTGGNITDRIVIGGDVMDVNTAGTYIVTYNVQDKVGNEAIEVTRTVIVDLTAPVITLNGDDPMYIGRGSTYIEPGATADDDLDGDISGNIIIGGDVVDTDTEGTYVVTYNVSDAAGKEAPEVTRTVIVDLTAPVTTLMGDNPLYIGHGEVYIESGATATDNMDGNISDNILIGGDIVDTDTEGTYVVTYNVSDAAGNAATRVERTVIVDHAAPVISLLGDNPMHIGPGGTYTEPGAIAIDNLYGDISDNVIIGGATVNADAEGIYRVTYNVSDAAGNAALTVERTVIVDHTAPVISLLGDDPLYISQGETYTEPGAIATDNLDGDISDNVVISGDLVDTGTENTYMVTYNVSDAAGNATIQVRNVIVDLTAPTITLLGDNPMHINLGDTFTDPGAIATDNRDGDISNNIVIGGDVVNPGTEGAYRVTYNVSDAAGNAATQVERTVIVDRLITSLEPESAHGDDGMVLYPNPAREEVHIRLSRPGEIRQILLFGPDGRLVRTYQGEEIGNGDVYTLDLSSYPTTTYFVHVIDHSGQRFRKQLSIK